MLFFSCIFIKYAITLKNRARSRKDFLRGRTITFMQTYLALNYKINANNDIVTIIHFEVIFQVQFLR